MPRPAMVTVTSLRQGVVGRLSVMVRSGDPRVVVAVAAAALAVRLMLIYLSRGAGGSDLRIYHSFSAIALHGQDPYRTPSPEGVSARHADNPPLLLLVFASALAVHDSSVSLRLLFAGADLLVIAAFAASPMAQPWKTALIVFYAFNPFVLYQWVETSEDKPILLLLVVVALLLVWRGRPASGLLAAAALAAYRIFGWVLLPVLALHDWSRRRRRVALDVLAFVLIVAVAQLPWFPDSLDPYRLRGDATRSATPSHASLDLVLARLGLYRPSLVPAFIVAALTAVLIAYAAGRIDIREAVVLSLFVSFMAAPDLPEDREILVTIPFLLLVRWSAARMWALWAVACVSAVASLVALHGIPGPLRGVHGESLVSATFGPDGSVRHALWMAVFPALVVTLYAVDRRRGQVTDPALVFARR